VYMAMAENGTECQAAAMMTLPTACRPSIGQALVVVGGVETLESARTMRNVGCLVGYCLTA